MAKVTMAVAKQTKRTYKFGEVLTDKSAAPVLGTLYVPKATLEAIGWEKGDSIVIDLNVVKVEKKASARKAAARKTTAARKTAATKKARVKK